MSQSQSHSQSPGQRQQVHASIADRMERLPFSRFHRNFLLMVTAGEFVETLMLLGNGLVLALVAEVLGFSPAVSSYVIPVSFFAGEFVGSIASGTWPTGSAGRPCSSTTC